MENIKKLFQSNLEVVNVGIESFYHSLKDQNVPVIHVEWKPPAGGNEKLIAILKKLNS